MLDYNIFVDFVEVRCAKCAMGGNVPSAGLAVIAKNHDSDFSPRELVGCSSPRAWPQPPALDSRSFELLGTKIFCLFDLNSINKVDKVNKIHLQTVFLRPQEVRLENQFESA